MRVAKPKKGAKTPKRAREAPTTSVLHPVRKISVPVVSELAKIAAVESSGLRKLLRTRLRRSDRE